MLMSGHTTTTTARRRDRLFKSVVERSRRGVRQKERDTWKRRRGFGCHVRKARAKPDVMTRGLFGDERFTPALLKLSVVGVVKKGVLKE